MLRRSTRVCKSKIMAEKNSHEIPIKRKRVRHIIEDDFTDDSLPENNSSGDEFVPIKSKKIKETCSLNLSESDSDNDEKNCNMTTKLLLKQSVATESEDDDNVCQTNFDFTTVLKSQCSTKHSESTVKYKSVDIVEETDIYNNIDVAKILSAGEGVNLKTILNNTDNTVDKEMKKNDNYTIPDMVEVIVKLPNDLKCKKDQDMQNVLKRRMNTMCKETQILMHKVHLLLWIFYGNRLNSILNSPEVMGSALSLIPSEKAYPPKQCDLNYLENYIKWFSKKIKLSSKTDPLCEITVSSLVEQFSRQEAKTRYELIAMFISMLRSLGLSVRLVINLNALSIKPNREQLLGSTTEKDCMTPSISKPKVEIKQKTPVKSEYFNKRLQQHKKSKSSKQNNKRTEFKVENISSSDEEDNIFIKSNKIGKSKQLNEKLSKSQSNISKSTIKKSKSVVNDKKLSNTKSKISEKIDRRVLSTDEEDHLSIENNKTVIKKSAKNDFWVEVFLEMEEKWFCVDVICQRVHCIKELYNTTTHPMRYVLAWYNNNSIKDITKRYDPYFHTLTRKIRVDPKWWEDTLRPYTPSRSAREREEDEDLDKQLEDIPLPKSVSEYKNHPLYVLPRHLLKFQAIYPPDPPTVGNIRNEPIYLREYVHELNGRDNWLKEARVVKLGEKSYKQVKARPRFDRNGVRTDPPPLELFGYWQTEPYTPPSAIDGQVPRNCYGNVDLFKPCMLPKGTVHLQLPGLLRVAKKLNIDCAPAVVGFDFHAGGSHPVNDGFVVCQEFKDILIDAWNQEIEESRNREQKRYKDRVMGNWKRLVKGILIREQLKIKYNYFSSDNKYQSTSKESSAKK